MRINELIIYRNMEESAILESIAFLSSNYENIDYTEETLKKEESWRQLYSHWTNACRVVSLRQLSDI